MHLEAISLWFVFNWSKAFPAVKAQNHKTSRDAV